MKFQFTETPKGAKLITFQDMYGQECSIQADNIQGQNLLWLGVMRDMQGNSLNRVLMNKDMAKILFSLIKQYIETDSIATEPSNLPSEITVKQ